MCKGVEFLGYDVEQGGGGASRYTINMNMMEIKIIMNNNKTIVWSDPD